MRIQNITKAQMSAFNAAMRANGIKPSYQGVTVLCLTREDAIKLSQAMEDSPRAYHDRIGVVVRAMAKLENARKGGAPIGRVPHPGEAEPKQRAQVAEETGVHYLQQINAGIWNGTTRKAARAAYKARYDAKDTRYDSEETGEAYHKVATFLTTLLYDCPEQAGALTPFIQTMHSALMMASQVVKDPSTYMPSWCWLVDEISEDAQENLEEWFESAKDDGHLCEDGYYDAIDSVVENSFIYCRDQAELAYAYTLEHGESTDIYEMICTLRDEIGVKPFYDYEEEFDEICDEEE